MLVVDWFDIPIAIVILALTALYIRNKMSAIENLNAALVNLNSAHGNLFARVQTHVTQTANKIQAAGAGNEAQIQSLADQVNAAVTQVNEEIAKIPVIANV